VSRRTGTLFSCVPIAFSIFPDHFGVSSRISPCFKRSVWCDVAVFPSFSCNTCRILPHSCNFCPSVVVFLLFVCASSSFFVVFGRVSDLLSWCVCAYRRIYVFLSNFTFFYIFLKRFWGLSSCVSCSVCTWLPHIWRFPPPYMALFVSSRIRCSSLTCAEMPFFFFCFFHRNFVLFIFKPDFASM
jgi:hypothetical protein